ncbi:MAG TPA: glycosyl hydrolase family 18 protein [Candidatus Dormibacteraeota bacterium]|nr:glycosyl hydrolase family 18 protein [Candidatus Dormibacteraeota bacterium]
MRPIPRTPGVRLRPTLGRVCGLRRRALSGGVHRGGAAAGLVVALATVAVLAAPLVHTSTGASARQHPTDPPAAQRPGLAVVHAGAAPVQLAPASQAPAPAPPEVATAALRPHEIFGFAPYWTLDISPGFDLRSMSTLAYFAVDANPDGTVAQSGDGWTGYQSQDLATLITRAHQSGVRVVLTVKNFDNGQLHALATTPGAAQRLGGQLVDLIRAKSMDGANLDFEGTGGSDRAAFAAFVTQVAQTLHAANPHWQVTADTYADSASDGGGFYDVGAMAPALDAFFVMAYDMYGDGSHAQPNAPLAGYSSNDTDAMAAYTSLVPASKVLLGMPFYGYDFTTADNQPNSAATGSPSPQSYAQIASAKHPVMWDTKGQVPFTSYQDSGGAWHELYYDNPQSLALKAQLVNTYRLRGLGVWALGMDGNDPAMMAALLGRAAPLKVIIPGKATPTAAPTSPPASSAPASGGGHQPAPPPPSSQPSPSPSPSGSGGGGGAPPPTAPPPPPPPTPPPLPTMIG